MFLLSITYMGKIGFNILFIILWPGMDSERWPSDAPPSENAVIKVDTILI